MCTLLAVFAVILWIAGATVYVAQMFNREREIRLCRAQIDWYESVIKELQAKQIQS